MKAHRDLQGTCSVHLTERIRRKRGLVTVVLLTDTAGWWAVLSAATDDHRHEWMGHARPLSTEELGQYGWALLLWDGDGEAVHLEAEGQLNTLIERMATALTERLEPGSSYAV